MGKTQWFRTGKKERIKRLDVEKEKDGLEGTDRGPADDVVDGLNSGRGGGGARLDVGWDRISLLRLSNV